MLEGKNTMTEQPAATAVVMRQPGQGPATWALGSLFEHLLGAEHTDGSLGVSLVTQPPGTATPLHVHTREAEAFFVLEGHITYRAGEQLYELREGCFIYLPTDLPHAFRVRGSTAARYLAVTTPAGLMSLYDEVGIPAPQHRIPGGDGPPMQEQVPAWLQAAPRYGLQILGPPIPE